MERAALALLLAAVAVACSSGKPPVSSAQPAAPNTADTAQPAAAADTAKAADPAPAAPAAPAACDHKIVAMSDPAQKQIQCANGESFVVRQAKDGKWYPEMRVRAGIVPGYATPDDAARARCCPPASE